MLGLIKNIVRRMSGFNVLDEKLTSLQTRMQFEVNQVEQKKLFLQYRSLVEEHKRLPDISDVGFRVFSQSDEDGILLFIFAVIGTTNKKCLDIAFSSPFGANTTNLLCNWGW